ncbi:ATP-binding cassette domain-containing protein [Paenibacillus gorillae]|uniref:ATP-binding cassette domain-containing protein n=1 Tax=Paenibacillus gorillae TaxID=1243662 RepID=UPI0004B37FE9
MLLEGKGLGYRYDRRGDWIFRDRNLSVAAGEIVGIAGPSGCGKTTFAKLLAGCAIPGEGEVLYGGMPLAVKGYSPVQMVFQHPERAVNPRWRMQRIVAEGGMPEPGLLEAMGIAEEWLGRRPGELSGGELQRFCIARALGGGHKDADRRRDDDDARCADAGANLERRAGNREAAPAWPGLHQPRAAAAAPVVRPDCRVGGLTVCCLLLIGAVVLDCQDVVSARVKQQ